MTIEDNTKRLNLLIEEIIEIVEDLELNNQDVGEIRELIDSLQAEVEYLADQ
jgi:hypothetical protein